MTRLQKQNEYCSRMKKNILNWKQTMKNQMFWFFSVNPEKLVILFHIFQSKNKKFHSNLYSFNIFEKKEIIFWKKFWNQKRTIVSYFCHKNIIKLKYIFFHQFIDYFKQNDAFKVLLSIQYFFQFFLIKIFSLLFSLFPLIEKIFQKQKQLLTIQKGVWTINLWKNEKTFFFYKLSKKEKNCSHFFNRILSQINRDRIFRFWEK